MSSSISDVASGGVRGAARSSRVRLIILALITFATVLNYLDRAVLGVAAPTDDQGA